MKKVYNLGASSSTFPAGLRAHTFQTPIEMTRLHERGKSEYGERRLIKLFIPILSKVGLLNRSPASYTGHFTGCYHCYKGWKRHKWGMLLQNDHIRVYTFRLATAAVWRGSFKQLSHTPYSPYLASEGFFSLSTLEEKEKRVDSDALQTAIKGCFIKKTALFL